MIKNGFMIYDWMVEKGLSGNELVCFAYLYKATGNGQQVYNGGYEGIAKAMGVTFPTAYNVLRKLRGSGMVTFDEFKNIAIAAV